MKPAQERLAARAAGASASRTRRSPLVNNVDAQVVRDAARRAATGWCARSRRPCAGRSRSSGWWREGVDHASSRWDRASVLAGLVRKIAKGVRVLNVEDPESLEKTVAAAGAATEVVGLTRSTARSSLVTGASRGHRARHRPRAGGATGRWSCCAARDEARLAEAVAEIRAAEAKARGVALDVGRARVGGRRRSSRSWRPTAASTTWSTTPASPATPCCCA